MRYLSFTIMVLLYAFCVHGQTSPHGKEFKIDCGQCHTSQSWKVNTADIQFNHSNTIFKLVGQHTVINCRECHKSLTFKDERRNCIECHTDLHNQTLGKNCERCHTQVAWIISDVTSIHQQTRFPLLGAHRTVSCRECHTSASVYQFETLGIDCVNCHKEDYLQTTTPNHVAGRYSIDCLECHSENSTSWNTGLISHDFFPLTGGHAIGCGLCHLTKKYEKISAACNICHNKQFTAAQLPRHFEAGIPLKCETCHSINAWKPSTFEHLAAGYELKDSHKSVVQCSDCHKGNLTTASQGCISCHKVQYDNAPDHKKFNYNVDCSRCHSQKNWIENSFNHASTNYPLTGAHKTAKCGSCHLTTLIGTPTVCSSCHLMVYTNAQVPGHVAAGIPKDCASCHTTNAWKPSSFKHITTGFELKGAHSNIVQCSFCHKGNVTSAPQICIGCHQAQYDVAPGHKQNGFAIDCTKCHSQNNWLATSFDHTTTLFPLTGAHSKVLCSACHVNGYINTPTVCQSCHLPVYNSSQLPGHVAAGIPKDCATCHTSATWKPSSFNHTATGFELKGAHKSVVQCSDCHKGSLTTTVQTCISCHQPQFDTALNHKPQSYPADCTLCHTQNNWIENIFNHATTSFPLTGAHTTALCAKCHTTGLKGTPTACYSCHAIKYNASVNPNHLSAKFPTNCEICHTSTAWTPSTYNHDAQYFPIYSGKHQGKWNLCSDCHHIPTNYATFTCILCHEHSSKTTVDADHTGVKNYTYASTACYNCHPQGR